MKKTMLLIVLCVFGCYQLKAEKNESKDETKGKTSITLAAGSDKEITEGGFYINIGLVLPSNNYFTPVGFSNTTGQKFGSAPCLELGHMFRLVDMDNMAIGVRATWLSAFYSTLQEDDTTTLQAIQGSIIKLGPYFTYGLSDGAAFDFYYQIAPTHLSFVMYEEGYPFFGATHSFGFGFRFSILNIGMDYNLGNVKTSDDNTLFTDVAMRTSHLRFFIGIKI